MTKEQFDEAKKLVESIDCLTEKLKNLQYCYDVRKHCKRVEITLDFSPASPMFSVDQETFAAIINVEIAKTQAGIETLEAELAAIGEEEG
mgnify:CR=1 FL=1